MNNKVLTITIGIPAYNEALNIGYLVESILKQTQNNYLLEKIIISSDGSTDETVEILNRINSPIVQVFDNKDRAGQAARLNQIISTCTSDCLVILNADVRLEDEMTISTLVGPMYEGFDLVSGNIIPSNPNTLIEKTLNFGIRYKNNVMETYKNGDNYLTCHGPIRALSKNLYTNFKFEYSTGEDEYSYLFCKKNGYKYKYLKDSIAFYKLPTNLRDHIKQAHRYFNQEDKLVETFGNEFVKKEMQLPKSLFITQGLKMLMKEPLLSTTYVLLTFCVFVWNKLRRNVSLKEGWDVSASSKILNK